MENVFQEAFELQLKPQVVSPHAYMPRVYEVNLPCQWLTHSITENALLSQE